MLANHAQFAVFAGLDVGKQAHHVVALDRHGQQLLHRPLPQDETALRTMLTSLTAHGPTVLVVDQPATIGSLAVAVAQDLGIAVGYLPGLTVHRMADAFPGEAKTDARDAFVIAETARVSAHLVRTLELPDATLAELRIVCGFDADLVQHRTAVSHRIRGLLTQLHPALERVLGPELDRSGVADLLQTWPTPAQLRKVGHTRIERLLKQHGSRQAAKLTSAIRAALAEQTVEVVGTAAMAQVLPRLAAQLQLLATQRTEIAAQVETLVKDHPLFSILTSMAGVGVKLAAVILVQIAGKTFDTAAQLASYAGVAPVTRQSGTSQRGERAAHRGNKVLKDALYQAAFASLRHGPSRAYYDKQRARGKTHAGALLALARKRVDVLFAMLRDDALYEEQPLKAA